MRHADGRMIAKIEKIYLQLYDWQNEAKMRNPFNVSGQ